jgi:Na+-driven multidrug efflux pump
MMSAGRWAAAFPPRSAGDRRRRSRPAATLALHAAMIGACAGIFFTAVMLTFGRAFYTLLGGRGGVLEQAMQYSHVLFSGAMAIWLVNTLASVVRGPATCGFHR